MAYKITEDCITCGSCKDACPTEAIAEGDDAYSISQEKCTECGTCVETCPSEAIIEE